MDLKLHQRRAARWLNVGQMASYGTTAYGALAVAPYSDGQTNGHVDALVDFESQTGMGPEDDVFRRGTEWQASMGVVPIPGLPRIECGNSI